MKRIIVTNSKGGTGKSTLVLSLADALDNSEIIDLDPQGSIKNASKFTNRHVPIEPGEASKQYLIYDTPPYNNIEHRDLFKLADYILLPIKESIPDLLATTAIIQQLEAIKQLHKAWLILNEVRKPHTNTYKECKALFLKNFSVVKIAKTELTNLVAFRRVFSEPLGGLAREQVNELVKELGIL